MAERVKGRGSHWNGQSNAFWPWRRTVQKGDAAQWKGYRFVCVAASGVFATWRSECQACGKRFQFRTGRVDPRRPSVRCRTCAKTGAPLTPYAEKLRAQERSERGARAVAERREQALRPPVSLPPFRKPRGGPAFVQDGGWWRHALPRLGEFTKWKGAQVQCVAVPPLKRASRAERFLWRVEACRGCRRPFTFLEAPHAPAPRVSCDVCEGVGVFG